MKLKDLLSERKSIVIKKWFDLIFQDYPADATNFFKKQKNRFANPVGHTIFQGIDQLFDELVHGPDSDSDKVYSSLDDIIRIKAVQDFSPSQALSFIFLLKKIIREEMEREIRENQLSDELASLESDIDKMALLAFDIFMKCRERIYEIKADEVRRITFRLLQKAKLVCEIEEEDLDSETVSTKNIKG
jgi:hypothetical protein